MKGLLDKLPLGMKMRNSTYRHEGISRKSFRTAAKLNHNTQNKYIWST